MEHSAHQTIDLRRQRIQVRGIVQGVGFRPFVYRVATGLGLVGFVRNDGAGVTIEVEGSDSEIDAFISALSAEAPPLSQIESLTAKPIALGSDAAFRIVESDPHQAHNTLIAPDVCICDDCLAELLDPADRRYRYPFINCTNCGPRFTIVLDTPYDRQATTMRTF